MEMELSTLEVVRLEPGDVLVLHAEERLTPGSAERIRGLMREKFPDHEALIYDKGLRLSVIRPD